MEKKYLYEINFVRAVACLFVVMVHVGARFYGAYDGSHTTITNFFNQLSRIGTPLFAVMSGFLLYNQMAKKHFKVGHFLKSRMVKIISPFVVWSLFYLMYDYFNGIEAFPDWSNQREVMDFTYQFITGESYFHLYFISLVIQFYFVFLLIRKWMNLRTVTLATIASLYINYLFITNEFDLANSYLSSFINSRTFLLQWIYYFMLGALLVKLWPYIHQLLVKKSNQRYTLITGLLVILFTVLDYHSHQQIINSNENVLNFITIPIAFVVLISLYYQLIFWKDFIMEAFIKLGNMSMGIYLIHPFVIGLYERFAPYDVFAEPFYIIPFHIMVVLICILLLKIISYIPFSQYIVTLVPSNTKNIHYNMNESRKLIKTTK
ncbi:acyltransferase [Halobacillus sp. A5]|uniref:acyltransferase n=1 Tax=Halobacillus sp. A5 TaxID=2880263 RepID=UPI0020A6281B|nr:acyltransferase [Halobacillus sp. A5]MCP3028115.1 acyltransferase [Halobacillus sp. A5]